ncbi:uncharacterized protein K460DRAFT_350607 [Cucurbitaria berberidis CBS 394.84]|uniref:Uncharacterized protein n=1 Tax=Cucurbitaria berberidis CBS 394.84 TaxID=1168544 RepID=A0A9P4LD09_9PLEO|nr:uncharacterized protein K460DRAFT_350607 [Cucurbitaria berberidis CBS 394.84]KAF1850565.1 hypothetical protein K460DRAFT_350607 [Cucurbitaria berberidis CBS 394.84]
MALKNFNPDVLLQGWSEEKYSPLHSGKTFAQCIREAFNIPSSDSYVYRAQAETTLDTTQNAIGGKRIHGLHGWYHDDEGNPTEPQYPTTEEISAYTNLFDPSINLPKTLNGFKANSKANTLRSQVANHLSSRFHNTTTGLLPSKKDRQHINPYFSLWTYSCHELEWAGPLPSTTHTKISHHILPIFYHHFGCIVPSYAALHVIAKLAQPAKPSKESVLPILDIGSGNGYWTFMLRHFPIAEGAKELDVRAIDSQLSEYRVSWIQDTIAMDGKSYLKQNANGKGCVLLLVYPQATGDFTAPILRAFEGDTVVVAGTQNGNGFTAFQDQGVDEWVEGNLPAFELVLRMPLPSFAGKDEALFVFRRKA